MEATAVRSAIRLPPLALLVVALHTAVLPHLRLFGVGADVMLLVAIAAGLVAGPREAAWTGFLAGLIADCFTRTPFGLSALTYCLVGYGVGQLRVGVLEMSWWLPAAITFMASALGVVTFVSVGMMMGQEYLWSWRVPMIAGVVALLNMALGPLITKSLRWALRPVSEPRPVR